VVVDGRAVAICRTVRVNGRHREAGVDTAEDYRLSGYGSAVVAAWGQEVIRNGLIPLYSTSWDNHGSIGIAERLHLEQVAVEINIEQAHGASLER
jgi:hypothetical protein